jgi:hypothetical protein
MLTAFIISASVLILFGAAYWFLNDSHNKGALNPVLLEHALDPDLRRLVLAMRQRRELPTALRAELGKIIVDIAAHRAGTPSPPSDAESVMNAWRRLEGCRGPGAT